MADNNKKLVDLLERRKYSDKKIYRQVNNPKDINILDSYVRNRVNKKRATQTTDDSNTFYLKIIAKQSSFLKSISQNIVAIKNSILDLVKIEEESKSNEFFMRQKEKENLLEEQKRKKNDAKNVIQIEDDIKKPTKTKGDGILGFIESIVSSIKEVFSVIFKPKNLLKLFGKIFVIANIIIGLFKGVTDAYERWKKTGDLKEAIITGLGSLVESLTFGLFGEDSIKNLFDSIGGFLDSLIDTIKETFTDLKDWFSEIASKVWNWFANNIGIPKISLPSIPIPEGFAKVFGVKKNSIELGSIGPYYPLKDNTRSEEDQKTSKQKQDDVQALIEKTKLLKPKATPEELKSKQLQSTLKRYNNNWESEKKKLNPNAPDYEDKLQKINAKWQGKISAAQGDFDKIQNSFETTINPTSPVDASINPSIDVIGNYTPTITKSSTTPSIGFNSNYTSTPAPTVVQNVAPTVDTSKPQSTVGHPSFSITNNVTSKDATPAPMYKQPLTSGTEISASSVQIAEKQRLESTADQGITINSPTNNVTKSSGKESIQSVSSVYDTDFMLYLSTT